MKKYYCDACVRESTMVHEVKIPCHIAENKRGYVDLASGEDTSGRKVGFDLCLRCYNIMWRAAFGVIETIKTEAERCAQKS